MFATIGLKDDGFKKGIEDAKGKTSELTGGVKGLIQTVGGISLVSKSFEMIGNSIGAAVARYDTLNRFPQMLQAMGFEASATEAATQKLSAGIAGLPTKLDDIVSTAQNLTVLTGNLELSTDTALALNNAFLASGASSADASRGMQQYTQQLAKGTVDMQSWRTLQETMGYALRETAKEMGFTGQAATNDLYKALQSGTVTFDQFNAKLIQLSTRTGGFADMAKSASAGIGTSFTNMQTAIVRGVTAIITALDKNRNIQIFIESVGKGFEGLLKTVAKVAEIAATVLAPALTVLANSMDTIMQIIVPLTVAFVAYRAVLVITSMVQALAAGFNLLQAAMLAMPVIMNLVTAAQTALNIAMMANPIGLIVAAIAALVTGLVILWNTNEDFRKAVITAWNAIKETSDKVWGAIVKFFKEDIPNAINNIPQTIEKVVGFFGELPNKIGYAIGFATGTLIKWAANLIVTVTAEVPKIINAIIEFFKKLPNNIAIAIKDTVNKIKEWAINLVNTAKAEIPKFIATVIDAVKSLPSKFVEIGKNIVDGIWKGIVDAKNAFISKVNNFFKGIVDGAKKALGIASPSKVFAKIGKFTGQGFINGLLSMSDKIDDTIDSVFGNADENVNIGSVFNTDFSNGYGDETTTETMDIETDDGAGSGVYNDYRVMNLNINGIEELNALVDWWNNKRLDDRAAGVGV